MMHSLLIAALAAAAGCMQVGAGVPDLPCGWCTCTSLEGGHYEMRGGGNGKSVTLTAGSGDSRDALEQAIRQNDVIILDGSEGPFVVSKTIKFENVAHKTIVGINGAQVRTMLEMNDDIRALMQAEVPSGLSSTSGGGTLSNGKVVREAQAFRIRQALIDYTGDQDESYRNAGIFKFWSGCEDLIIRDIAFVGPGSLDIDGNHLMEFAAGAHHIWIDHCSFTDAQRTSLYFGAKSDFASVTWCTFDNTERSLSHRLSTLVGGEDKPEKYGMDNLNVTYAWCSWGPGVAGRTPMVRFGNVHCVNCYYNCHQDTIDPRTDSEVRVENCYFDIGVAPIVPRYPERLPAKAYEYVGNYSASGETFTSDGNVTMPYIIDILPARKVKRAVLKGAGPRYK